MNREVCKFFSGAFAALAFAHGTYAVATAQGLFNEPVFLGRRWGIGYMLTETVVYSAISVALGYAGWSRDGRDRSVDATAHEQVESLRVDSQPQPVSG